ncbi:hypothetical protein [Intestinibacter bartlettii]|uniref:Uncharacterized protein n=1 Tax=Intestinibacter bartlettii TaxID=261299 RepID=A0ABS6DYK8_9FIRM|nr:hypothetical protein [Intestinibacter bartlettii]MBU5336930.1 hypothetical protein [Intestinibacter bartlettii]MDO5010053.1 hypothetical protein [Intestinibacter bartlettii]
MDKLFILLLILFGIGFIYFLFMVSIQFTRINKINLLLGMDVTKLYDNDDDLVDPLTYLIRKCAMFLYKVSVKL